MAEVNGRRFTQGELQVVFRTLDTGGKRDDVREAVKRLQGKGVANETIRQLRDIHRTLRRSEGWDVKQGGTRGYLSDDQGRLKRPPPSRRLSPSARPAGPQQVSRNVTATYNVRDSRGNIIGQRVGVFHVGPNTPSLATMVAEAAESGVLGSVFAGAAPQGRRGYSILEVKESND